MSEYSAAAGRIPRPPEHRMRYMLHYRAKAYGFWSLSASIMSGLIYAYCFVLPQRNQYRDYVKNYDAYEEMRRICNYPKKYMITCPSVLAERLEEKGFKVAADPFGQPEEETQEREEENANSVESFNSR